MIYLNKLESKSNPQYLITIHTYKMIILRNMVKQPTATVHHGEDNFLELVFLSHGL